MTDELYDDCRPTSGEEEESEGPTSIENSSVFPHILYRERMLKYTSRTSII
jgi:hypothetical protein